MLGKRIASAFGPDEIALMLALALLSIGFWQMPSWRAGACLAPAAVLLWQFLPQRKRFVEPGHVSRRGES